MDDTEFPVWRWADDHSEDADQYRIEWAPVGVEQLAKIASDDSVAEIEIRDAVGRRVESRAPCLEAGEQQQDDPGAGACRFHVAERRLSLARATSVIPSA